MEMHLQIMRSVKSLLSKTPPECLSPLRPSPFLNGEGPVKTTAILFTLHNGDGEAQESRGEARGLV